LHRPEESHDFSRGRSQVFKCGIDDEIDDRIDERLNFSTVVRENNVENPTTDVGRILQPQAKLVSNLVGEKLHKSLFSLWFLQHIQVLLKFYLFPGDSNK